MKHPRDEIRLVVLVVGLCALVSGPLVSGVDFTPTPAEEPALASATGGTVTVGETTLARTDYRLTKGDYGSGVYVLRVPPAHVTVAEATGRTLLTYQIDVPELGYATSVVATVDSSTESLTLRITEATIPADAVSASRYDATARLTVRSNETSRVVDETNVTLTVER